MILHRFPSLPSTNELLLQMAEAGAAEWTAVVADVQTRGRGREGRAWHSPAGGLYISLLLRPRISAARLPRVPLVASLALFSALERPGVPLALKWPNDLLLNGRKVAGLLLEARTQGEEVAFLVLGCGVNLRPPEGGWPPDLACRAAALSEWGDRWDRDHLPEEIAAHLARRYGAWEGKEWEAARAEWWARRLPLDLAVVKVGGETRRGCPVGLSPEGALLLRTPTGVQEAPMGGTVVEEG